METRHYWEENGNAVKYDNYNSNDGFVRAVGDQLNFAAPSEDEAEYPTGAYLKKGKVSRQDPLSHRIIEKRRRDRMNNCLADLSRLIPPEYLKKGRGRVEKTEIIEMAIRHLKYLQDRANAADRQSEDTFRAGYQEAVTEAVRFLVEVHGYGHGDGLCGSLASHLQRHVEVKGGRHPCETARPHRGFSSETTSSSSSSGGSHGYGAPPPAAPLPAAPLADRYDGLADTYGMDCERVTLNQNPVPMESEILPEDEPIPLDARKNSPSLRAVRKPDHAEDYLQSYKFKNSIERRFSRSQDNEACDMSRSGAPPGKLYSHKQRRAARPAPPHLPASTSTEENRDTSPQDTSNESSASQHHHYDKPALPTQYVPVFALNEIGKYYVPMSVEPACLARQCGALEPRAARRVPLHPVTIHVSFQPCRGYVKREPDHPDEQDWRPA